MNPAPSGRRLSRKPRDLGRYCYSQANVAYRHSRAFRSDEASLVTWLRLGELAAERQNCAEFNEVRFKHATAEIRKLTSIRLGNALQRTGEICNQAGVSLALVKPLPRTRLSGAAWWLSPRKAVIQLSARHRTDDHLWFTFFHEAAHILLHSKKSIFVDEEEVGTTDEEDQANTWACNALVPQRDWEQFVAASPRSKDAVQQFASEQQIAPGIIVGMLQYSGRLPWSHLNGLKVRLEWKVGVTAD